MVIRRVEQVYKTVWNMLPPQTRQQIATGLRNGDPKAIKQVSSIFKIPYIEAKKFLGTTAIAGISANKANASANTNPNANTIKALTDAEKAKLQEQGRSDLIQGSKSVVKQGLNYVSSDAYLNEMKKYVTPELLKSQATDLIVTSLLTFLPGIPKSSITPIINQAKKLGGSKGVQYVTDAVRNMLVKANPKAAQRIKEGTEKLTGSIEGYFKNIGKPGMASKSEIEGLVGRDYYDASIDELIGKDWSMATQKEIDALYNSAKDGSLTNSEASSLTQLVKQNAEGLKALASELGVKSKQEIPTLLKFVKDTYQLLKNSPNHIKATAIGTSVVGGLGGLTLFDMYQSYRENGDTYSGLKTPMGKVIKHVLGYDDKSKLAKAAAKQAGLTPDMTPKQQADAEQGLYSQDLINSHVDEFFTGISGRKYHNKDGYIYDFSTGRPVKIADAISDFTQKLEYDDQRIVAMTDQANQQLADLQNLKSQGYNITDDQLVQAQNEVDTLSTQKSDIERKLQAITEPEYDTTKDLTEQYKANVVQPQQQAQQAIQQEYNRTFDDIYKAAFERIASDTYNDMDNYYGPQQQNYDYFQYSRKVANNEAPWMSIQDFVKYQKMDYMKQMAPKIQQTALQYAQLAANQLISQQNANLNQAKLQQSQYQFQEQNALNQAKFAEEQRQNQIENRQKLMNYLNEVDRTNIQAQHAMSTRQRAEAATEANKLRQQEIEMQKQIQPYKQMEYMGSSLSGASMGGLTPDQFINANPEVAKQVFPSAFQEGNQPQQEQPKKQNFVMSIFNQLRGNQ